MRLSRRIKEYKGGSKLFDPEIKGITKNFQPKAATSLKRLTLKDLRYTPVILELNKAHLMY